MKYIAEVLEYFDRINGNTYSAGVLKNLHGEVVSVLPLCYGEGYSTVRNLCKYAPGVLASAGVADHDFFRLDDVLVHWTINRANKADVVRLGQVKFSKEARQLAEDNALLIVLGDE